MKKWLVILPLLLLSNLQGEEVNSAEIESPKLVHDTSPPMNPLQKLEMINEEIDMLTHKRNKELLEAAWAQNQANRLRFRGYPIESHHYAKEAKRSRMGAEAYQEKIDSLNEKKEKLLLEAGIAPPPPKME